MGADAAFPLMVFPTIFKKWIDLLLLWSVSLKLRHEHLPSNSRLKEDESNLTGSHVDDLKMQLTKKLILYGEGIMPEILSPQKYTIL